MRRTPQALLHLTWKLVELRGPTSGVGHAGPRSTGHEAMEQFVAEGIIAIGRLYLSTRDTVVRLLEPPPMRLCTRTVVKAMICHPVTSILPPATVTGGTPARTTAQCVWWRRTRGEGSRGVRCRIVSYIVTLEPAVTPPSRQVLGPIIVEEK